MLTLSRILPILFLSILTTATAAQSTSLLIGSEPSFFLIDFPLKANQQLDTLYLGEQPVLAHRHVVNAAPGGDSNYILSTNVSKYPAEYIHSDSSFQLIEGFINSTVSSDIENGVIELLNSTYVFKNGFPGKSFSLKSLRDGGQISRHVYLVENYLVELEVASVDWFEVTGTSFLGSFRIDSTKSNRMNYGFEVVDTASFSVIFPDTPEVRQTFIATEAGIICSRLEMLERELKIGNIAFIAQEAAYPEAMFTEEFSLQQFYNDSIEGLLKSSNSSLVNRQSVMIFGHKGYQVHNSLFAGKMSGYYRTVLVGKRLYMVGVLSTSDVINEEIEDFFGSFRLKE